MIRPAAPADTPALVALSGGSGLFQPDELGAVRAMLDDYHANGVGGGRRMIVYEEAGTPVGVAYFAPKEFADRVWELLLIAVDAPRHRRGIGSRLLRAAEDAVRAANGRLLLIETSDRAGFERTRRFYRKHAYAEVARIPDYFADGDGKASFLKRIGAAPDAPPA
jgi:ribosomal protein S18 acetylase RimI-like enzyme